MSTAEHQLRHWLHAAAPEPPRQLTVADIAARLAPEKARRQARTRRWAPALAAAAAVLVVVVSAVVARTAGHSPGAGVAGGTGPARPGAAVSLSPVRKSAAPARPLLLGGPWQAELIRQEPLLQNSLAAYDGRLYAVASPSVVRLDPATGAILARAPAGAGLAPVFAAGAVWTAAAGPGAQVRLRGYTLTRLAPAASVTVPFPAKDAGAGLKLAAGPAGQLIVAAGQHLAVVELAARHVVRGLQVTGGQISALAVSSAGDRLYVAVTDRGSGQLRTYQLPGGALLATSALVGADTIGGILPSAGGIWGVEASGMTDSTFFAPAADLARAASRGGGGGGGLAAGVTISGRAAWLGGTGSISCADPVTGRVRASARIPVDHRYVIYLGPVTYVSGHAFAVYLDQNPSDASEGLARLRPPAACGR
jgi:hypothetical protein